MVATFVLKALAIYSACAQVDIYRARKRDSITCDTRRPSNAPPPSPPSTHKQRASVCSPDAILVFEYVIIRDHMIEVYGKRPT